MADVIHVDWADVLRHEGILAKGYGVLPKYVMLDRDLSLTAKTIYAFLCSLAGNGETTYPSVETIKSYLGIGESAYSARLKELLDTGYILREKRREANARFAHNLYTIARQPKRFRQEEGASISGILSAGYGMIPRAVMFDPRLDCKAKGLYAYLAAFTGAGNSAFPERDRILRDLDIANNTYYKYLRQLQALNYITVAQSQQGRFGGNTFILNDNPAPELAQGKNVSKIPKRFRQGGADAPCIKNPGTEEPCMEKPCPVKPLTGNPCTEDPDTEKPCMENPGINNNSVPSNTRKNITFSSNQSYLSGPIARSVFLREKIDEIDSLKREELQEFLSQWFQVAPAFYDRLTDPGEIAGDQALVSFMADFILERKPFTGGGLRVGREEMLGRLLSLTREDIAAVRQRIEDAALISPIRNPKAYGLLALYNQAAAGGLGQADNA